MGGGMTPVLAAGFHEVADTYNVTVPQVALTTGLYMLGLGLGSVVASPTAILWGKRPGEHVDPAHLTLYLQCPVYLAAIVLFCGASIWCAFSPNCKLPSWHLEPSDHIFQMLRLWWHVSYRELRFHLSSACPQRR